LHSGTDRAGRNGQVENKGDSPLVKDLVSERLDLFIVELLVSFDVLIAGGVLGDKSTFANERTIMVEILFAAEVVYIGQKSCSRKSPERILDSW
jgi:hypothetical protein